MDRIITGICPVQGKKYSLIVHYLDVSNITSPLFVKELSKCEYNKFGDKCNSSECPLIQTAPDEIHPPFL